MLVRIPITIIISFVLASPIAALLHAAGFSRTVAGWFSTNDSNGRIITVVIVAVIIFIALRVILHKLTKLSDKARENKHILGKLDRLLGIAFGLLRFIVVFGLIAIAFRIITIIPFLRSLHDAVFSGSVVALWLYDFVITVIFAQALAAAGSALTS